MSFKRPMETRKSFGATAPPFIDYLKDILRRYPDGGQILKELIQNADDAGATRVVFIHDKRNYGHKSILTDEFGKYQGPALFAFNDAKFTSEDWQGIQATGRSVKRKDPNKVGRFGIGFNSVYHITDVPWILSSDHLAVLDPHEKLFGQGHGGYQWSLADNKDQETLKTIEDQFRPFQNIVEYLLQKKWTEVLEDQHFNGTLFRFPLRNEISKISDNLYNSDKVAQLFDSFIADAEICPLFLKSVQSVSLIHITADSCVNVMLEVTSSCSEGAVLESSDGSIIKSSTHFKDITVTSEDREETKNWLLTTCCMKEGNVQKLDSLAEKLSFLPQVDLAFPCGQNKDSGDSRLSCFLPLPNNESNKTGLPVYVNACFGLTDNRRHIKWQEEDQKHDEGAMWNELLVKEVLPQAYLMILKDAIELSKISELPLSSVYGLWPDLTHLEHKEKWHSVAQNVLQCLFRENIAVLSLAADEKRFVCPSEAVLPCDSSTSPKVSAAIQNVLISCGVNLVKIPEWVDRAIERAYPHPESLKRVTPTFLRTIVHKADLQNVTKEDKVSLLEYVLSDGTYEELQGLPLLPLSDGTFRSFTNKEEDVAFIDSQDFPRSLLPGCKHLFIPQDLSTTCQSHLKMLATRDIFNIINIDADKVTDLAKRYLPTDWKQGMEHVTWEIANCGHPPAGWLQEFWKFLNTHFRELSGFTGMPLISIESQVDPTQSMLLARIQQNTTLIFQRSKQNSLPQQIAELVRKVGGTVVRGGEWLKHEDIDSYVLPPSPRSVLQVFVNTDSDHLIKVIQSVSHDDREELKNYICCLDSLSAREQDVLSKLPLFQTMKGSCVDSQSKQAVILGSRLTIPTELTMPDHVIQCVTEADRRLLQLLNIDILDTPQAASLLINCVQCDSFGKDATEKTMTWILEHGGNLFSQNKALKAKCKELNFIQLNGGWKKASQLFDPRIETFKDLFPLDFFPPAVYTQTAQMLQSLTELGLLNKEADITTLHLLDAVKQIEKLQLNSYKKAVKRAEVILCLLNSNDVLSKFSEPQLKSLLMMKWVPCVEPGQQNKERLGFFCPHEIGHTKYEDIVGHVMPLKKEFSEKVRNELGITHLPPPLKVLENMSVMSSIAHTLIDPDPDVDFNRKLHSTYMYMQGHIYEFAEIVTKDTKWLWAHNKFVSPVDLVLDYPPNLDLSSYIGKIPKEFLPYQKLLIHFGLRQCLSREEIVGILNQIKDSIEERHIPVGSPGELKMAVDILNWMGREKIVVEEDIPVPVITNDEHFTLKPLSTTVFCDISRDGLEALNNHQEEFYVIHAEIPRATAEWLKIPLLSTRILSPEMIGIQQCGQSEPIAMRIKNILNEYDEEHDIFKELIQNAEDARAKACRFMVDFRVHKEPPESLIDPGMTACQGPCLWSYNDEQFTEDDWTNIVRVGSASKENMVDKIGKFGLGFNTVYHVTDCPSILSGSHLLMLDPNVTHLKKHIKEKTNPGIKLDLTHCDLFKWFPGQFKSYENIFDCHFSRISTYKPYQGTLIKLPFRTQEEAFKSEISTKVYNRVNIVGFQNNFMSNSQMYLLFLKNINTVSLQNITSNASTPPQDDQIQTKFNVSKTIVRSMKIPDQTLKEQIEGVESLVSENKKCYELTDCHTAQIVQIEQQESGSVKFWLLYNCFGTQQCLKMIHDKNKEAKFTLPVGGIAVALDKNPNSEKWMPSKKEIIGQAFCFLPLSIKTGLPVNLNGSFAVTSNRKALWARGVKNDWNKALLQDPAKSAYITVLSVLKNMSQDKDLEGYCYFIYWPDREKVTKPFQPLVDAFYSAVVHQNAPEIFSDGEHWCCFNKAIFLHESIEENKEIGGLAMRVAQSHVKAPNHVVPLPIWLRNSFKQAGFQKDIESRTWNWETFYEEAVFRNLATMDAENRNALVLHAIDLDLTEIDDLLMHHPCIPTKGGQLQCTKKVVYPTGKVACLFRQTEGRLLDGTKIDFSAPRRVQRLLELGMLSDYIPLEEIAQKVGSINNVWKKDKNKACVQLKCIMEQLRGHLPDKDSLYWESIRNTAFLPAFSPESGRVTLQKPIDVFHEKYHHLVNMTEHVLDHTNLETYKVDPVLNILRVRQSPPLETVLQQLESTSFKNQSSNETRLHEIVSKCYTFLDQWLKQHGDTPLISERAHSFPFILVGCKFVHAQCVAENEDFEAKPYLHVLPLVFAGFKSLWESVGIQKKFTRGQYLTVIEGLHASHGQKPLSKPDLNICLTVLRGLYEKKEEIKDCLIPNEHGVLQPAAELSFNDSPWMLLNLGVTLCHEDFSRVMACHFGIKTTKHQTLENSLVANMSPFDFEFEQREELTLRIKNIIEAYPSKKDILKELIQNADDAEATEIHLVWDKRQHGTEKTFGKKWNHLQGPALCVYNNKVFSDADLKGIQQLGEGGKHNTPGKTGKYGIGFNSVYNITDCPSILTGDKILCISDPNQTFIEQTSGKTAGCGYKLDSVFKETYLDVYKSFLPKEFTLEEGTMFRLPLRIGKMANNSKISAQGITAYDIEDLFSALLDDPEGLILFSKNIQKIQLHKIEDSGKLENVFKVEKSIQDKSCKEKTHFQMKLQNALKSDGSVTPYQAIYRIRISTSSNSKSEWVIADQFGSLRGDPGRRFDKLPQASVAACVDYKPYKEENFKGGTFCTLPLPVQTGLPVHVNGNFEVDSSRRDLWKEDGKSLKVYWNGVLKIDVIAPLYADLLHNICRTLPDRNMCSTIRDSHRLHNYLRFFPFVSQDIAPDWQEMIHEVYRTICNKALDVIPVSKSTVRITSYGSFRKYSFEWCNVKEAEQTDAPHLSLEEATESINPMLERLGMKLVPFSSDMANIWESLKAAGVKVRSVSPSTVNDFLREKPLNDPTKTTKGLPLPIEQTLIQDGKTCAKLLSFCLKDEGLNVKNKPCLISGLPLLLTNDQVLRVFDSSDPKLITRDHSLFCGYEKDFVDYLTIEMHIEVLQPKYVKKLTIPHAEKYLKAILPRLLKDCEFDPLFGLHVPNAVIQKWLISAWQFFTREISQFMTFSTVRELFDGCQMVPVVCPRSNNKPFLQTMMSIPSVIQFSSNEGISSILFKLGCMRLDIALFVRLGSKVQTQLDTEFLNTRDQSAVLDLVFKLNPSEFCNLSNYELNELQRFLQFGLLNSKDKSQYQRKVKSLPIFETLDGKRVRIDGPGKVFIVNGMPSFPDLFNLKESSSTFLKQSLVNEQLSEQFQIPILSHLQYFVMFILPVMHALTEEQILRSIKMLLLLQIDSEYPKHEKKIISSMKEVKLIRSIQGNSEMASFYFDDHVRLYTIMLPQGKFVPQRFWKAFCDTSSMEMQARELVKELGMRHFVSNNEIIAFAYQIESESKGNCELAVLELKSSKLLLVAMKKEGNDKAQEIDKELMKSLADIKFLLPVQIRKDLCTFQRPAAVERTVALRGSLIGNNHQHLIWTSMPIIAMPHCNPNDKEMIEMAGAFEEPPMLSVTTNMANVCQVPCQSDDLKKIRAFVFRQSYAYLQNTTFPVNRFTGLPVVLVENDTQLVKAEETSLGLPNDLDFRPYLYKIQPKDAMYAEFFKRIGVTEVPTVEQYCQTLTAVFHDSCEKQTPNSNQKNTIRRAVEQIFLLLKRQEKGSPLTFSEMLYLPSKEGKLYPSNKLYFNDTVFQASRLEKALKNKLPLLESLRICHLGDDIYEHRQLVQMLPENLQPKMLSQCTEERLGKSNMHICQYGKSCEFSGWFEKHLSSIAFRHGLICLLREQSKGEITQEDAGDMCEQTFGRIQIICCRSLETELCLDQQPLNDTVAEAEVYVKKGQQGCTFYLKHNDDMAPKVMNEINLTMTKEINALLGNKLASNHLPVLGVILMCDSLQEVQQKLAKHGIHDSAEADHSALYPAEPGSVIPDEWLDCLDMNMLNNFEEGEHVGYLSNDIYIYAVIVKQMPEATGAQLSRRYEIQTNNKEFIEVSSVELYQFIREKKPKLKKMSIKSGASCMVLELHEGSEWNGKGEFSEETSSPGRTLPASFDEAKREIDKCLEEIWTLSKEEKHAAIKRLYLRWHPDKNPDCIEISTEAFKYLMNRIDELTNGKTADSSKPKWNGNFRDFYGNWNQEARRHRNGRERFYQQYRSSRYNFWTHQENVPRPNRAEAQRWLQQARCDLAAAENDIGSGSTEWCLFKVHQIMEKALIAAEYKKNGKRSANCTISIMAARVACFDPRLRELTQIVDSVKLLGVDAKKTQYPDNASPIIPHEQFKEMDERPAVDMASELLCMIEAYVH
ncbi:sacsin [Gadus macrocephalus]|uniref:sacsin n=1 Tax=Gadus macrocephalus TaxID=80720 RepID=UPI0028CB4074|nr:sacsin [Gadus macrocephalus]XP_059896916.1 sacsin [Gadus macrocephalus]